MRITAKIDYQKPNPQLKHSQQKNHKISSDRKPPPPHLRQIDSSQLPQSHLCLKAFKQRPNLLIKIRYLPQRSQTVDSARKNLMQKYQQSYYNMTQSLKSQQRLPPSLIHKCKSINTDRTSVNFFIEPLKGWEAIKTVLIILGDILLRSHLLILL